MNENIALVTPLFLTIDILRLFNTREQKSCTVFTHEHLSGACVEDVIVFRQLSNQSNHICYVPGKMDIFGCMHKFSCFLKMDHSWAISQSEICFLSVYHFVFDHFACPLPPAVTSSASVSPEFVRRNNIVKLID